MNAFGVFLFQIIVIALGPTSVFAQGDAGVSDGDAILSADQTAACVSACIEGVARHEVTVDQCVPTASGGSGVAECTGLDAERSAIRSSICDVARSLVGVCPPEPPSTETPATEPTGQVAPAASETRPRPRHFELICRGGTVEGHGWRSTCVCPPGRVGFNESRYVLPPRERRERYSSSAPTVVRVVHCVPTDTQSATAQASVRQDLDQTLRDLQESLRTHDQIEAGRCGVSLERWHAMSIQDRARCGSGSGVSEERVREIMSSTTGFVTHPQLQDVVDGMNETNEGQEQNIAQLDARLLCLEHDQEWQEIQLNGRTRRVHCSRRWSDVARRGGNGEIQPGMFGFRLAATFSAGFLNLHLHHQDAIPPLFLGGEFGLTGSFANRWYLEGAVAFGYAFESPPFQESLHGQYRLGFLYLFEANEFPLGIAFGGTLSERYSGVFDSGTFRSDHSLAGAYVDLLINAPRRGVAFFGFVRLIGGVGLRFYDPGDHVNADGAIQLGIGIARFGDEAPAPPPDEEATEESQPSPLAESSSDDATTESGNTPPPTAAAPAEETPAGETAH